MAVAQIRPDWTVGTISLTSGSVNFTTTGSSLESAVIQGGDSIITRSGDFLVIATITGQNSGTLMQPCPASAAGAAQPLRIRYQPDGSRYNGATAMLIQDLSSGNLTSFSELVGSAGKVPVFTGAGTFGLADIIQSVNGKSGVNVSLVASDVGAVPASYTAQIDANTTDRHIHGNMSILNASTAPFTTTLKTKLDGVATGATANQTNAYLLARANHTGSQAISTVTGLQPALDAKQPLGSYASADQSYNWIINPGFTINQRGGVKKPANGVYGFDRWKGHASGINQIIESLPAGEYTLSWTGGGTGSIDGGALAASPITKTVAGGNISVIVPQAATWVQVVAGKSSAQVLARPQAVEESLCFRYFYRYILPGNLAFPSFVANGTLSMMLKAPVTMRAIPTLNLVQPSVTLYNLKPLTVGYPSKDGFTIMLASTIVNEACGYLNTATPSANYTDMTAEL